MITDKNNISLKFIDSKEINDKNCLMQISLNIDYLKNLIPSLEKLKIENIYSGISLTNREEQILKCLSEGKNNTQIAKEMCISVHTAKVHIHNIFTKLSVQDRTEAVVKAIKTNLIEL